MTVDNLKTLLVDALGGLRVLRTVVTVKQFWLAVEATNELIERIDAALAEPVSGGAVVLPQLSAQMRKDMLRFHATSEDGQDYDVPKARMIHMAAVGLVRSCGFGRYEFTDYGSAMVDAALNGGAVAGQAPEIRMPESPAWARSAIREAMSADNGNTENKVDCIYFAVLDEAKRLNKPTTPICDCRQGRDACTCKSGE